MDEKLPRIKAGDSLPDKGRIYRYGIITERDKANNKIPVSFFTLNPKDKGELSVDWEEKTTPEETIARIGATYKYESSEYKDYEARDIYALEIDFLRTNREISSICYSPSVYKKEKGRISNPSHSLIAFEISFLTENKPAIYTLMRDHAKDKKINVDMKKAAELVDLYREEQKP